MAALIDKSKAVRYRACMLLAYSLKKEALLSLEAARENEKSNEVIADIDAAIDSIINQNSHYFVDRKHTGKIFFNVM